MAPAKNGGITVADSEFSSPERNVIPQAEVDRIDGTPPSGTMGGGSAVPDRTSLIKSESGGTLIFHENLDGHTIRKHVGKTDEQLLQRFDTEPDIPASSTYPDIETAQRVVGEVLSKNRDSIQDWLTNARPRHLLSETLDFEVGRVIPSSGGATVSQSSSKSFVLLIKDPLGPKGYRVHTSYPELND